MEYHIATPEQYPTVDAVVFLDGIAYLGTWSADDTHVDPLLIDGKPVPASVLGSWRKTVIGVWEKETPA